MSQRLSARFAQLRETNKTAFIPFIMGGDPGLTEKTSGFDASLSLLKKLPHAGADIIEIGIPFSDPMADGPVIEAAGYRALAHGMSLRKILQLVREFRVDNTQTPVILMGYYNPLYRYGVDKLAEDAAKAGVDGFIIVDLPPEEEAEIVGEFATHSLDLIRLIAPTTPEDRQRYVTEHASGFVYYISVKGVTGGATAQSDDLQQAITNLRRSTSLPIAVGFGIKTPEQAAAIAPHADAVVVGSALVTRFAKHGEVQALKLASNIAQALA